MSEDLHILIVDDDEVDRMAIRRTLSKVRFQVNIAETDNAHSAMEMLGNGSFTWVLMDYRLPDMDGISLIKNLRRSTVTIPLIVLTGQGDEQTAVELMKAGASDYLAKSRISPEILSRMLHNSLRIYRAEQRVAAAHDELTRSNALLLAQNYELEQQRKKIAQQNLELVEAYQLKSEFLATISHELRTPLNAILGFSQILQSKQALDSYHLRMIKRIFSNGEHLLNLVNDILDFSNIESQRLRLQPSHFNLEYMIIELVERLKPLSEEKKLDFRFQLYLHDPMVWNDRRRLNQVLLNLLSNAIKFTESGYVNVILRSVDSDRIQVIIQDTGIGIAEEQLPAIFEAFRQVDQSIRRNYAGTGLGLAISDSLVRMMEGQITVESQVGKGSIFRVEIPRRIASCPYSKALDFPSPASNIQTYSAPFS